MMQIRIKTVKGSLRRAGRRFDEAWSLLAAGDLTPADSMALLADPRLVIETSKDDGWVAVSAAARLAASSAPQPAPEGPSVSNLQAALDEATTEVLRMQGVIDAQEADLSAMRRVGDELRAEIDEVWRPIAEHRDQVAATLAELNGSADLLRARLAELDPPKVVEAEMVTADKAKADPKAKAKAASPSPA